MRTLLLLFLLGAGPAAAQSPYLASAGPVSVLVEGNAETASGGASDAAMITDVELLFRSVGVPVSDASSAGSLLWVEVRSMRVNETTRAYAVSFRMMALAKRPGLDSRLLVALWSDSTMGYAGNIVFESGVRGAVVDVAKKFSNEYLKANPPRVVQKNLPPVELEPTAAKGADL